MFDKHIDLDTTLKHTGEFVANPSIVLVNDEIIVNLRLISWNNPKMHSRNVLLKLNKDFSIIDEKEIVTLPSTPVWDMYTGLEDGRLVHWNDTLFLCGSRRDELLTDINVPQMVQLENENEVCKTNIMFSSQREKNWMPISDMPNHFIRFASPLHIVNHIGKTILIKDDRLSKWVTGLRGSSQVIPYKDEYRICVIHEVDNINDWDNRTYYHRFIIWDKNWNVMQVGKRFKFTDNRGDFCCGIAIIDDNMVLTYGDDCKTAHLVSFPLSKIDKWILH